MRLTRDPVVVVVVPVVVYVHFPLAIRTNATVTLAGGKSGLSLCSQQQLGYHYVVAIHTCCRVTRTEVAVGVSSPPVTLSGDGVGRGSSIDKKMLSFIKIRGWFINTFDKGLG